MKLILDISGKKCYHFLHNLETKMGKALNNQHKKGGNNRHKWVQVLVSPDVHKRLRQLALDENCTLAYLLGCIIKNFVYKEE